MNQRRALAALLVWYAATLLVELAGGAAFAVHEGWVGLPGIGVGPVSVFVREDSSDRSKLTTGQKDVVLSARADDSLLPWLEKHGEPDPFRLLGANNKPEGEKWQAAYESAKEGGKLPWLVILRNGRVLASGPLPESLQDTMRLVKRYTGQ